MEPVDEPCRTKLFTVYCLLYQCTTRKIRFQRANPVIRDESSLSCPSLSSAASMVVCEDSLLKGTESEK